MEQTMLARKSSITRLRRSDCPIANTLDVVGDKWSLLVVRDLLHGKKTYGEVLDSPERIPSNILAERLKRLEAAGLVVRSAYQQHPVRYDYTLTDKGLALGKILLSLVEWGKRYIPGTRTLKDSAAVSKQGPRSATNRAELKRTR
jgi:DNA-binding HxlR family transcriptional regulator